MIKLEEPFEDTENPCYCPDLPAAVYLETLRARMEGLAFSQEDLDNPSFASLLYKSAEEEGLVQLGLLGEDLHGYENQYSSTLGSIQSLNLPDPKGNLLDGSLCALNKYPSVKDGHGTYVIPMKRKRQMLFDSTTFSDLKGPTKRERSIQLVNQSSFDVSDNVDRLVFSSMHGTSSDAVKESRDDNPDVTLVDLEAKLQTFEEDELHGPNIGLEIAQDLSILVNRIASLLPGLRLRERLKAIPDLNHQKIADFLGCNGLLNPRILDLLRAANIWQVELTESAVDAAGLNLSGRELLRVFVKTNSFTRLTIIDLRDTPLRDGDITYIHHLPALAALLLDNTGIGNEAIFHLVRLRHTLTDLHLRSNPAIDDDAIPALIMLAKLRSLSLYGTSVGMNGLRRFAEVVDREDRRVDVEIPEDCEGYIEALPTQYLLNPPPPLVTSPSICSSLSVSLLRRNLTEHAKVNEDILAGGTRAEMVARLEGILERRKGDLVVRAMISGEEGEED